ncbi:hypothetical protein JCM1840_006488 [Sporobolomyces johnsonii]
MAFLTPSQKFRAALSSPTASLSHLDRVSYKLQSSQPNVDYITSLRNTDPSTRQTSVHIAANAGRVDVVEWLIDEGHEDAEISRDVAGETVLHIAAAKGHVEILGLYLSRYRFVVDWVNSRGMTPLHTVAMRGQLEAAQDEHEQILLDHGADLNAPDLNGNSPLHYALSWGKLPVVKLLVELDCQTDSKNNQGFTAAEYAYSFAAADALKVYIRLHLDQRKAARSSRSRQARTARSDSRSSSTTPRNLRQARQTSSSALSISLPPNSPPIEEAPTPPLPPLQHSTSPLPPPADSPAPSITSFASGPVGLGVHVDGSPHLGPPLSASVQIHPRSSSPSVASFRPETPQSPVPSYPSFDNTTSPARSARSVSNPVVDPSHPSPSTPTASPRPPHAPSLSPLSLRRIGRTKSGNSPLSTPTNTFPHSPTFLDSASSTGTAAPVSSNATPTRQTPSSVESSPVPPSSPGPNKLRKKTGRSSSASAETQRPVAAAAVAAAAAEGATILGGGRGLRGERSMSFGAAMASTGEVPGLPANLVGSPGRARSSTTQSHDTTFTDSATSSSGPWAPAPGPGSGMGARPASRSSSQVRPSTPRTQSQRSEASDRVPSPPPSAPPVPSASTFAKTTIREHDPAFVVLAGSSTRSSPMLPSSSAPPATPASPPLPSAHKLRKVSAPRDRSESAGSKASAGTASTAGSASGHGGHGGGRLARALGLGRKGT